MSWWPLIVWTSIFLVLEGFFSGSELALVSADKLKLTHRASQGKWGAKVALYLAKRPQWLFSTTLLGQNLFIVANSTLVTFFIYDRLGDHYEWMGLFLSPLVLIFGEAVPKSVFQLRADRLAPLVSPILLVFSYLFFPIVWFLSKLTELLMGGIQGSLMTGHEVTRESLEFLLQEAEAPRELSPVFKRSLLKILSFAKKDVHDIMTPLIEVFSVRGTTTVSEAIAVCSEEGYSTVPVFQKKAYYIIGVVNYFHLVLAKDPQAPVTTLMEDPLYVPPQMRVKELFLLFQDKKKNFAVVVDEFGGSIGIVTLEDIAEAVLGPIQDEYDEERAGWKQIAPSQYLLKGRVTIDEVNERLRWNLPREHYETISGFLLNEMKRFPQPGEVFHYGKLIFLIKTASARSIDEVLVEIGE